MTNKNDIFRKPAIKYALLRVLLFIIGFLIVATLIQTIGIVLLMVLKTDFRIEDYKSFMSDSENFNYILLFKFLGLLAVLFTVWIFRKFIDRRTVISLGLSIKNKSKDIISGFGLGFVLITLGFFTLYIAGYLKIINITFNAETVFGTFLFFAFVAIQEEILFRGYILNNLMTSMNKYVALAISAVLFALIHVLNPNISIVAIVNLILAGFVFGFSYIFTKNLWLPISFHLSWNYFLGPFYGFEVSGLVYNKTIVQEVVGSTLITGGKFGFEGSLVLTALLIIGFFAYKQKGVFNNEKDIVLETNQADISMSSSAKTHAENKNEYDKSDRYRKTKLSEEEKSDILRNLNEYMRSEKPYMDCELNLRKLSEDLHTTPNKLSQVINSNFNKNFFEFVNEYRIKEVKLLLKNQQFAREKIMNIAYDCGFNSKSSFFSVFKRFTSQTPAEFKNMQLTKPFSYQ